MARHCCSLRPGQLLWPLRADKRNGAGLEMLASLGLEESRHLRVKSRVWGSFLTLGSTREAWLRKPGRSQGLGTSVFWQLTWENQGVSRHHGEASLEDWVVSALLLPLPAEGRCMPTCFFSSTFIGPLCLAIVFLPKGFLPFNFLLLNFCTSRIHVQCQLTMKVSLSQGDVASSPWNGQSQLLQVFVRMATLLQAPRKLSLSCIPHSGVRFLLSEIHEWEIQKNKK